MLQRVEIYWLDAFSEDANLTIKAIREMKPLTRRNLGYVLYMDDDRVTITNGVIENLYHNDTGYDGALTIPRGMIIEVKEIS